MRRRPTILVAPVIHLVCCFVSVGCASAGGPTQTRNSPEQVEGQIVTEDQIARSGARTAWDALRLTVHNITFGETGRGQPTRITRRGRSSAARDDGPRVLVDGVALTELSVLTRMPASDVLSIEVVSGIDATTRYGTDYTGGVIKIRTKGGA